MTQLQINLVNNKTYSKDCRNGKTFVIRIFINLKFNLNQVIDVNTSLLKFRYLTPVKMRAIRATKLMSKIQLCMLRIICQGKLTRIFSIYLISFFKYLSIYFYKICF